MFVFRPRLYCVYCNNNTRISNGPRKTHVEFVVVAVSVFACNILAVRHGGCTNAT